MFACRSCAVGLLLIGLAHLAIGEDAPVLIGTVTKVTDGDTITVKLSSGPITVRFDSIDAPERNQPWGTDATAALAELLDGQEVSLDVMSQDRYDRLVAVVYLGDGHVNAWMVEQGHAWAYRQYMSDTDYCRWEDDARRNRRGLWSQASEDWVAPWEWRRGAGSTDYSGETVARCIATKGRSSATPTTSPRSASGETGQCLIKGNISENGRIYHVPGSRNYDATRIDESKGEWWFCTEAEARAAGWRAPRG